MSYEAQYRVMTRSLAVTVGERTALTALRGWRDVKHALKQIDESNGHIADAWRLEMRRKAMATLGYVSDICDGVVDVDPGSGPAERIRLAAQQVRALAEEALAPRGES